MLPTRPRSATFRVHTAILLRHLGYRFTDLASAERALATALRGAVRPLAGILFAANEPSAFRKLKASPGRKSTEAFVFLTLPAVNGYPARSDRLSERLADAGGLPVAEDHVLGWWQDHWGRACHEGESVLASTGRRVEGKVIGTCTAVVAWGKAGLLMRAIETLTGGPHQAIGWLEAPLETGCTLRIAFTASRKGAGGSPLLLHQLKATLRSYGARMSSLQFDTDEQAPDYLVDGRGTPNLEGSDAERLSQTVSKNLHELLSEAGT
jgi:hypothetical protein